MLTTMSNDVFQALTDACGGRTVELTDVRAFRENIETTRRFPTIMATNDISPIPGKRIRVASFVAHYVGHEERLVM